jgi:sarcosine oxidase
VSWPDFDLVVVGGGPMGASAARYLAQSGARVLLLAPRDPEVAPAGQGVPSSHADISRITRRLDTSLTWGRLAVESVERYRSLERESGIEFFTESGCLAVIEGEGERAQTQLSAFATVATELEVPHERLAGEALERLFPALHVAPGTTVLHESTGAGWIDPRAYVRAQIAVGLQHGLEVIYEPMVATDVRGDAIHVTTLSGRRISADRAIFAMGPYSAFDLPVADSEELLVFARTVVHVRLSQEQLAQLGQLPSLIVRGVVDDDNCYILPPTRYPDGEWYIKIGGGRRAQQLRSREELLEWYATEGDPVLGAALRDRLSALLPATAGDPGRTQACAITVAASGVPRVVSLSDRTYLVTGGNGHAAKSGDEIGRLAAELVLGNAAWDSAYSAGTFSA